MNQAMDCLEGKKCSLPRPCSLQ